MARSSVRRNGQRFAVYGAGAFVWSAMMFSMGVFLFSFMLSVAHVAVQQYEQQLFVTHELSQNGNSHKQSVNPFHAAEEIESATFTHVARHLLAVSDEQKKAEEESGKAIIEFKRSLPRYNLYGERVNNTFNPTDLNYYQSLVVMIIPCAIISILSCCVCCCFFICRQCCNLCGGKHPKEGGYSLKERYIPKQLLIAVGLIAIVTCVFGFIGNSNFSAGLLGLFDVVHNTTGKVVISADNIGNLLSQVQSVDATSVSEAIRALSGGVEEVQKAADSARDIVDQVNQIREGIINAGYVLSALAAISGMIGALLNKGKLCLLMVIGGFLSLSFLWMSFGIHLPTSILMADACDAIDTFINAQESSSGNTTTTDVGLETLLSCVKNDSYGPTLDLSNQGLEDSLVNLNNYTLSCCNVSFDHNNLTLLNVSSFPVGLQPQIAAALNDYFIFMQILEELKPYLNCSFIRQAYNDIDYTLCVTMLKGIDMIMGTQGLLGVAFIPAVYLAILGWKRLSHPKDKRQPNEEEMEHYEDGKYGEHPNDPNNPYHDNSVQPPYIDPSYPTNRTLHDSIPPAPPTDPQYPVAVVPSYPVQIVPQFPAEGAPPQYPADIVPSYPVQTVPQFPAEGVPPQYPADAVPPQYPVDAVPPQYPVDVSQPPGYLPGAPPIQNEVVPPASQQPPPYVEPRASIAPYQEPNSHLSIQP